MARNICYDNMLTVLKYGCLVLFAVQVGVVLSYNIETNPKKVGKAQGERNSQFGYTVAIVRKPGWTTGDKRFLDKELLVGAPYLTYNKIIGHGQVTRCMTPTSENITCISLDLEDPSNLCAKLKRTTTDCAFQSRLGATIEVNRNYNKDTEADMVTVCAPGWKNVYPEIASHKYQNDMPGMCLRLRDELQVQPCTRSYCWPFWPGYNRRYYRGRPQYNYAEGGMSATYTKDGFGDIIGAPGADDWRGAFKSYQKQWTARLSFDYTPPTMYFGYALTVANLWKGELVISGAPNWNDPKGTGHFGKVYLYIGQDLESYLDFGITRAECPDQDNLNLGELIDTEQTGTKFGAALAAVDVTGDGYDELFVGAPFYTGDNPEEGRVFVYSSSKDTGICGPIGILSGGVNVPSLKDKSSFARFGAAIASIGDLDIDGYNDVAIGAPYEDDGTGAIYIYPGIGKSKCEMKDPFTQRIAGRDLDIGLRSFGWSMYGDEDIDDNSFPDLAVGAYESDTVLVFRARPLVNVIIEIEMTPNPIPLIGSLLPCSTDNKTLCFTVKVKFRFVYVGSRKGKVDNVYLNWTLDSDTLHKSMEGWSRVSFRSFDKHDIITENITLSGPSVQNKTYIMDVKGYRGKPEPKDAWTKIRMEGRFELIPSNEDNFDVLEPILSKDVNALIIEDTEFDKKCDNINTCSSDLRLQVEMFLLMDGVVPTHVHDNTVLYVDAANMLQVTADVLNLLNSSYTAKVSGEVSTLMKRDVFSNNGLIGASCKYKFLHQTSTIVNCTADIRLDRNENMKIKMYYDISRQRLIPGMDLNKMKERVHISMLADQANLDVDTSNNDFKKTISVKLKYAVHVQADKETFDQIRYKADESSTQMLRLIHRYVVTNEGPSFLPKTYVNITIPLSKEDTEFASIVELPSECVYSGTLVETSTQSSTTTKATKFSPSPDTKPERRRREVEQSAQSAKNTGEKSEPKSKAMNITCNDDYSCEVIICEVLNLEHNKQHIIDIKLDVFENNLAKEKEFLEIHYATYATVTDPFIWYGGKVVPWNKTVFAEKWTTFVVELTSDVSEMVIWIIIGSVLGALAVLIIVVIILWKCGFFTRKKHKEVQEWKRARLYNRKSVRMSNNEKQPYSAIEETET
ncbi:integrin alpha-3-like [Ruditapes philippinarum]|uniref:integrin alpha-3-like n=1 Tax=Ruditapes philippinarum TaxID=129788 RepID=UPI00295C1156|nr:integrin alpha-3-like [Ruditapes philippinarum]